MRSTSLADQTLEQRLHRQIALLEAENGELRQKNAVFAAEAQKLRDNALESQESGRRSELLADALPQIVWTSTPDGRVNYYNRGWFEYTGMTFEQTQGDGWKAVMHPDDLQRGIDRWQVAMQTGEAYEAEFRLRRASDGMYRWHLSRNSPMRDAQGQIAFWVGTSTDIHEYKIAQQSLRQKHDDLERRVAERTAALAETVARLEAEKRFIAAIVDNVSDGIIACDAQGVLILMNPAARAFHGFGDGPIPQQPWVEHYDLYLADGQTRMPADQIPLARVLRGEEVGRVELVIKPPNGVQPRRTIVGAHAFFDSSGNKLGAVVGLHDITERAAAEERFRILFEHSSDAHLLFDDSGIIDCNRATIALLGCSDKAQVLSLHPAMLSPEFQPDGRRSMEKCFEMDDIAREHGFHRFEWIHRKMDGTDFPAEVTLTPVKLKGKDAMIVVWHDLTEQKRAEAAITRANSELRENEQRYRTALAAGAMGTFTVDLNRGIVINDKVMNRLHDLDPSVLEWPLDTGFGRVHPEDRAKTRAALEKAIATGQGDLTEYRIMMPDGSIRWLSGIGRVVGPHAPHLVVGVQFDITDRKSNEERARQSQQRFQTFMDHSPAMATIKDAQGKLLYCNQPFKGMFPEAELGANNSAKVMSEETANHLRWLDQEALEKGSVEGQLAVRREGGILRRFRISKFRFIDADCQPCVGTIWHDVTELVAAREGAEAANRAKGEFLANMSHEIRTPMTAILGHVDLLDQSHSTGAERGRHLEVIRRNGKHLLSVLNDILDLSKIEAGKMGVERISFSPVDVIRDVESLVTLRASQKGIDFGVEISASTPAAIFSDPTRVRQILLNLVGNAIKFTERGSVRLLVGAEAPQAGPAKIRFDVIDTGIGMTPEQLASLFTAFSQADSSTSRKFGGSGLGLAICKRLCDMLGGRLAALSEPGKGSRFSFWLDIGVAGPLAVAGGKSPAPTVRETDRKAEVISQLSGRILLAEDSADIRLMVRAMLESAGLSVDVATDGLAAVNQVLDAHRAAKPYDLVLMDMQMPVLDGYAAARELRAKGFDSLPVIAFTAHAMEGEREKSTAAGCSGYLVKPINRDELLEKISQYLSDREQEPLRSSCADNPIVRPLLGEFVATLRPIADEMSEHLRREEFAPIREQMHKLKGAGSMYGFPEITRVAAEGLAAFAGENNVARIAAANKLIKLLRRVER